MGGGGVGGGVGLGGQGGCERKIEVFEKIHKNKFRGGGVGRVRVGGGGVRVDVNERRFEIFVKILKNGGGVGSSGGRVGG